MTEKAFSIQEIKDATKKMNDHFAKATHESATRTVTSVDIYTYLASLLGLPKYDELLPFDYYIGKQENVDEAFLVIHRHCSHRAYVETPSLNETYTTDILVMKYSLYEAIAYAEAYFPKFDETVDFNCYEIRSKVNEYPYFKKIMGINFYDNEKAYYDAYGCYFDNYICVVPVTTK